MKERIGLPRGDTMDRVIAGTRLLETIKGLRLTFVHDTCSSLPPYETIEAGVSLQVEGMMWNYPEADTTGVMVHFVTDPFDESTDLALTLAEVLEVTNLLELVDLSRQLAAASEASNLRA